MPLFYILFSRVMLSNAHAYLQIIRVTEISANPENHAHSAFEAQGIFSILLYPKIKCQLLFGWSNNKQLVH